jgi:FAD/FMN-containing dehydrogenase
MSKVAQYLQQHVVGEVLISTDAREYFSTDGSICKITPQIIVYPRAENDVRKIARFSWQLAERGRLVPLTARGSGTDLSGAALGQGVMIVFPAHMNKILTLDSNKGYVTVQPGINYGKLQQTLLTHGQFLPPYPASIEYSTLGGAVANDAAGEKSIKYGTTKDYAKQLRVVLANGEVITTKRLSKKELNQKKGLPTFEGELYRAIDSLVTDNKELIEKTKYTVSRNVSGYDLSSIKGNDGSFDLTPLFIGSQGTLGIVTEITLDTESYNPQKTLIVGFFDDYQKAGEAIVKLRDHEPSALEMVDGNLLEFIDKNNPNLLKKIPNSPYPKIVLFVEFDDLTSRKQKKHAKKAKKIIESLATDFAITKDIHEQEDYWKVRHSVAGILWQNTGAKKALPIIDDAVVPYTNFSEYITSVSELFSSLELDKPPIWGNAGSGSMHIQPFFDLSNLGDRQKMFKLMDQYYDLVIKMGGVITGASNDGRVRGIFVRKQYGSEIYEIFKKVKQICDPYGILNPGVKIDVDSSNLQRSLREDYSLAHLYDHMPRT